MLRAKAAAPGRARMRRQRRVSWRWAPLRRPSPATRRSCRNPTRARRLRGECYGARRGRDWRGAVRQAPVRGERRTRSCLRVRGCRRRPRASRRRGGGAGGSSSSGSSSRASSSRGGRGRGSRGSRARAAGTRRTPSECRRALPQWWSPLRQLWPAPEPAGDPVPRPPQRDVARRVAWRRQRDGRRGRQRDGGDGRRPLRLLRTAHAGCSPGVG